MFFVHLIDKNVRLYLSSVCASLSEQIYGPFHLSNNGLNQFISILNLRTKCVCFFAFLCTCALSYLILRLRFIWDFSKLFDHNLLSNRTLTGSGWVSVTRSVSCFEFSYITTSTSEVLYNWMYFCLPNRQKCVLLSI